MSFILGIVILALDIWALMNVWQSGTSDGAKIGWTIGVIIFPVLGFLVWILAGPKQARISG
ncbi:MAG TPA: PLD nuclease N-terminal domain-containing protein [Croceibacterium sp.]|nr:PLD nuclease N-terminal domain-containing protein [Croceibacterium sp.]